MDNLNGDYRILHRPTQYYEIIYRSDPHKKKPVIANYLTDGPFLGHCISGKDSFLYKLCEFSGHKIPGRGVSVPISIRATLPKRRNRSQP